MRSKSLVAGFLAAAVLLLAATLWSVSSQHTEFGRIHHSAVTHDYTVRQSRAAKVAEWVDQHSPLRLNLCRHVDLTPHDPHWNDPIILGTNQLCWALNSPTEKTGWLSFCLFNEFSTSGVWEFAPCSRHKLRDVRREDLNPTFVGIGDLRGPTVFGTNWGARAVRVRQGQIILARRVGQPAPTYVILFGRQTGSMETGKVALQIEYILAPAVQANQALEHNGPCPVRSLRLGSSDVLFSYSYFWVIRRAVAQLVR
jgi:hypothetical protein